MFTISDYLVTAAIIILILSVVIYFSPFSRTLWLIIRVSPYEQEVGKPILLVLGDSTGYGTGAVKSNESVAGMLGQSFSISIKNNSSNGRTIGGLLEEVKDLSGKYEVILLQIGANDILKHRDIKVVEDELRAVEQLLIKHTDNIVMMSSGNVGSSPKFSGEEAKEYENLTRKYREMFMRVANETKIEYVDLFVEPEDDPFLKNPEKYIAFDGLHPTSAGYEKWYVQLSKIITPILVNYKK
jgi:lysophospholipase L1-like esterase